MKILLNINAPYKFKRTSNEQIEKGHGYGSWAGQIIMSEDFDKPLEDLEE